MKLLLLLLFNNNNNKPVYYTSPSHHYSAMLGESCRQPGATEASEPMVLHSIGSGDSNWCPPPSLDYVK